MGCSIVVLCYMWLVRLICGYKRRRGSHVVCRQVRDRERTDILIYVLIGGEGGL